MVWWGIRYNYDRVKGFGYDEIAFMACPSMYNTTQLLYREPHGFFTPVYYNLYGYGNGQSDWGFVGSNPDYYYYDRNYLYGDLHASHLKSSHRTGIP